MMYKAVGFDYGGVLAKSRGPNFGIVLSEFLTIPHDQIREVYFRHNGPMNRDEITYKECWSRVVHDLGRDDQLAAVMELLQVNTQAGYDLIPEMIALSDQLRKQNFKTGILSNNSTQAAQRMRSEGLADHFDQILVSAETGYVKPDPAAFYQLAERLGVTPGELIFIDDTDKSLISAEEIGYAPILFTNYQQLLTDLAGLGITFN